MTPLHASEAATVGGERERTPITANANTTCPYGDFGRSRIVSHVSLVWLISHRLASPPRLPIRQTANPMRSFWDHSIETDSRTAKTNDADGMRKFTDRDVEFPVEEMP